VATANALQWQQITPVFCDIDPLSYNLDPAQVVRHITPKTTGIIGVHVWGRPCATEQLAQVARAHRLKLLYDASHAFGCSHRGRPLGGEGDAEVFSFHATKFLNAFEGGAIVTRSAEVAEKARLMRNFGFVAYDQVEEIGTNGKMSEVSAAMGLTSLEAMQHFIDVNRENYHAYRRGLAEVRGCRVIPYDEGERCNYQYVVVEVGPSAPLTRDELVRLLYAEGVLARRYFHPGCHQMDPYRRYFPHAGLLLPVTERQSQQVLSLPSGTAVNGETIADVCGLIAAACRHAAEIRVRLNSLPEAGARKAA
jgi:dTDP-4-amino-4,6-dideoxygalactose transaminase